MAYVPTGLLLVAASVYAALPATGFTATIKYRLWLPDLALQVLPQVLRC